MTAHTPNPKLESISFNIDGYEIAGIRHNDSKITEAPKLFCIHGWIDNANSFLPLLPYLPYFDLVAIDLPGNGYSQRLPQGYHFHDLYYRIRQCIEQLGWDNCHLMGHSLGGCIAPMLAVADPDCISSMVLIEASGPLSESASNLPTRLKRALENKRNLKQFQSRQFKDKATAINARLKAARMAHASAKLIIDRQVRDNNGVFEWAFDPVWRAASPQYLTEEQVRSILSAVTCPTLTIIAEEGYLAQRPETEARLNCLANRTSATLPGHHHLHMDTPEPVATAIKRFFNVGP